VELFHPETLNNTKFCIKDKSTPLQYASQKK